MIDLEIRGPYGYKNLKEFNILSNAVSQSFLQNLKDIKRHECAIDSIMLLLDDNDKDDNISVDGRAVYLRKGFDFNHFQQKAVKEQKEKILALLKGLFLLMKISDYIRHVST